MIEINNKKGMSNIYQNGDCTLQKGAKDFRNNPENDRENKKNGVPDTRSEHGRSMVEILGVLSIMGLLSIGALVGYRYALYRYRANEIINEVKKRAVIVSQQKMSMVPPTLDEFDLTILNSYSVTLEEYPFGGPYFMISVDTIEQNVCTQVLQAEWELPTALFVGNTEVDANYVCQQDNNTISFVFEDTLTNNTDLIGDDIERCSDDNPCQPALCTECLLGQCVENCPENEICTETGCICPSNFYLNGDTCTPCPENASSVGPNATECTCPELSVWKNGECVSCLDDIRKISGTVYHLADELDQCNNSCPEGYYAFYGNPYGTSNLTVRCASIGNEFSIDSKSDEWLVNKYNRLLTYSAYEGALGADEKEAFGLNLTAVQIRKRLHELLDEYYLPTFQTNWWAAQSWCRAKGGHLVSREKYFENGLRFAAAIASGGQYLRLWADGANIGSTWTNGRSTVWQSGGWDSSGNSVYFICEK